MLLILSLFVAAPASALTVKWNDVSGSTIKFGKSLKGGGPSSISLKAVSGGTAELLYKNKLNKSTCTLFVFCKPAPKQARGFKIFDAGKLVSRGILYITPRLEGDMDLFKLKVTFLAKGYKWIGKKNRNVCEKCDHSLTFVSLKKPSLPPPPPPPPPPPSVVPLPATLGLMLIGLGGLGATRRRRK